MNHASVMITPGTSGLVHISDHMPSHMNSHAVSVYMYIFIHYTLVAMLESKHDV